MPYITITDTETGEVENVEVVTCDTPEELAAALGMTLADVEAAREELGWNL